MNDARPAGEDEARFSVDNAPYSLLVGFADALAAPEVAMSLLGAGHRVVSFARRGRPVALRRLRGVEIVEVTAPEDDLAACMGEVADVAARNDLTMPLDDLAVLVCDRALPPSARVAGPRGRQARLALDKRVQLRGAEAAGLAVPAWVELPPDGDGLPGDWAGLPGGEGLPGNEAWPLVCKPALAAEEMGGRLRRLAPKLVGTPAELSSVRRAWGAGTPAIVQRWVAGSGGGVFGLAGSGAVHHLSAHKRVRMMNPAGSGSSACSSVPVPAELEAPIARFLTAANWQGMFMVELLRAGDSWWFVELNGRPWGSLALARRRGYEYPAWAVAGVLDSTVQLPAPPPFAELLCRHLGRELVHLLFVLRGPRSHPGVWPGRAETLRALLPGGRRTSWYNLAPGARRVFVEDTWRTVAAQTWGRRRA
ncbi:MAG: hypothetical protein ACHQDY_05175 [Solirubrobacterales bacterium]